MGVSCILLSQKSHQSLFPLCNSGILFLLAGHFCDNYKLWYFLLHSQVIFSLIYGMCGWLKHTSATVDWLMGYTIAMWHDSVSPLSNKHAIIFKENIRTQEGDEQWLFLLPAFWSEYILALAPIAVSVRIGVFVSTLLNIY